MVDNARTAWKWFSMQIAALGIAMQGAILAFPGLKDWLGDQAAHIAGILILAGIVAGRLVDQRKPDHQEDKKP